MSVIALFAIIGLSVENMQISSISENASAGSGKTTELVKRYIKLLYGGVPPDDIYCITFTNKATCEMKNRILYAVSRFADNRHCFGDEDIGHLLDGLDINDEKEAQKKFRRIFKTIHPSSIHIATIDSFLLSILRSFTFEASVPYEFDIAGSSDIELMTTEALRGFIKELYRAENRLLKKELFRFGKIAGEKDILNFFSRSLSSLFDIRAEIEKIDEGYDAKDFQQNFNEQLNESYLTLIKNKTRLFNFLRKNIDKIGKRSHAKIDRLGAEDLPKKLASLFNKEMTEVSTYKKLLQSLVSSDFICLWNRYKDSLGNYFEVKADIDRLILLHLIKIFEKYYNSAVRKYKKLSFSDIQNSVYNLLVADKLYQYPEYIYFRLDYRFKHLLIDEFQDTSFMQWSIIEPIARELTGGIGTRDAAGSFFYVGDPKQSIYRFRGAASGLFNYPSTALKMEKKTLSINYRSDRCLIDFYNKIFGKFASSSERFDYESVVGRSSKDGYVYADFEGDYDTEQILTKIVESIKEMSDAGFSFSDIAVLTEKNKEVDMIAQSLSSQCIPVSAETTSTLFNTDSGQIMLSILRYIVRPEQILKEQIVSCLSISDFDGKMEKIRKIVGIYNNSIVFSKAASLFDLESYFYDDDNLYKIFDIVFDINKESVLFDEFADRFEAMLKNCNKLSRVKDNSVKIMTIHKSKGLEFNGVILPVFPVRANRRSGIILSRDENFRINSILLSVNQNIINYSRKLNEIYKKEKEDEFIDELNRFYVTATRARHALFLFGSAGKPVFRQLKGFLGEVYRCGKPALIGRPKIEYTDKPEQFLKKIQETDDSSTDKQEIFGSLKERILGEAFHFAMEIIENFEVSKIDNCMRKVRLKYELFLAENDFEKMKIRIINLLKNEIFRKLIQGQVFREKSFLSNGKIRRIDLLVIKPDKINIIDYKIHYSVPFMEKYRAQLEEYRLIAGEIYKLPVYCYLLFVEDHLKIEQM